MFGKDFNPLMVGKQGEELTVFEKLNISDRLKRKKNQSILEVAIRKLEKIKTKKNWTIEETGENFPLMIAPEIAQEEDKEAEEKAKAEGNDPPPKKNRPEALQMLLPMPMNQGYAEFGYDQ